jgi:hypothetical protein
MKKGIVQMFKNSTYSMYQIWKNDGTDSGRKIPVCRLDCSSTLRRNITFAECQIPYSSLWKIKCFSLIQYIVFPNNVSQRIFY